MARRSKKNWHNGRQTETGKLIAAVLLMLVTLGAAGWGFHLWATSSPPDKRDKKTLCTAAPPKDIIVIVLDTTDGLPESSKLQAMKLLTDIIEASPENALLDLRVVDPAHRAGRIALMLCNPGNGEGLSELDRNPELAKRKWREKFREPLLRELEGSMKTLPSKSSPLLATFQGIALDRFTGASAAVANKKLLIVSDMIEYVPGEYSHYPPADLRYERFKTFPQYRKQRTDLQGTNVDFYYVDRALPKLDTGVHIQFWLDWIKDNNGRFGGKSTKLQGAGKS